MKTKTTMRFGYLFFPIIGLLLLGACKQSAVPPTLAWSAYNQEISEGSQLIFNLTQPAGLPMLIKAWGYEVEFELTTTDLDKEESHSTRTPYIRLGPQFQLLEKREVDAEIQITLKAIGITKNSNISVEAYELSEADPASKRQTEAYRLISDALESTQSENKELWQVKVGRLQAASRILGKLGQDETRMWIQSYEYYFTYFPLYQYNEAITKSRKLEIEANQHGLTDIELLTLQIQGQALIERNSTDTETAASRKRLEAQSIFDRAMLIAEHKGYGFEQAWITLNKGSGFFYSSDQSHALEEAYRAESLAIELSDQSLLTMVQSGIVALHVDFGEIDGAIDALKKIVAPISVEDNPSRVARILSDTSRLHSKLYEFPQSINLSSSALAILEQIGDQESLGNTRLHLASTYFEIGNTTRALELLDLALVDLTSANYGLGLYASHKLLANIYRHLGKFKEMNQHRDQQLKYLSTDFERTSFNFEIAKDLYTQGRFSDSKQHFTQAHELASTTKRNNLGIISSLYICLIENQFEIHGEQCSASSQNLTLAKIQAVSNIRMKFEGLYLWAQIQLSAGKQNEAFTVLDELVDSIRFYRTSLPGVLGAWFWENNKNIFETYLKVAADRLIDTSTSAIESLNAIQKINSISSVKSRNLASAQTSQGDLEVATEIRTLIANLESGKSKFSNEELINQLDKLILSTSDDSTGMDQNTDSNWLHETLAKLPENSALLTIYVFGNEAYVWIADRQEITLRKLAQHSEVNSMLAKVKENIRYQGNPSIQPELESLGRSLLQPVMAHLPETIFFLPLGEFNGFPLEALKVDGQYLIEQHQVINVRSLDSLRWVSNKGFPEAGTRQIFIAGNQSFDDNLVMDLPGASNELVNIANIFSDSDIHFAIGKNLSTESFYGPEIKTADIIHIASHAMLDVNYPELSRIYLSPDSRNDSNAADAILVPSDIRATHFNADLVFLSACQTSGLNQFAFDSNLGFVSEFIDSGAGVVIASLWPISDSDTALLVKDFYTALKQNSNVASSLTHAKRKFIKNHLSSRIEVWAAFQIYL